jgi:type IV pilus assembly protein PilC
MCAILAFSTFVILPVFSGVYAGMASKLVGASLASAHLSRAIGVASFALVAVLAVIAIWLYARTGTERGRQQVVRLLERTPLIGGAMYQLALSRFTAVLATYLSSGIISEEALLRATETVDHRGLRARLNTAYEAMVSLDHPRSLAQAIGEADVFEPLYARMLNVGTRSGSADATLAQFSELFFDDAVGQIDHALDLVEPIFAAFLTLAVGAMLVAVMLPLVGIMSAIG